MTIPLGRHRLSITLMRATAARERRTMPALVGMDDHEVARCSRRRAFDYDQARWDALALFYGGVRRP